MNVFVKSSREREQKIQRFEENSGAKTKTRDKKAETLFNVFFR